MKTVLVTAEKLKKSDLDTLQIFLLVKSIQEYPVPPLVSIIVHLFEGLILSVFPETEYIPHVLETFKGALINSFSNLNRQPLDMLLTKSVEVYRNTFVCHGLLLVEITLSIKSSSWKVLS
jgi:hypothetical protein